MQRITVKNATEQKIGVENSKEQRIGLGNAYKIVFGGDPYEGDYDVTPKVHSAVVLSTNGKAMLDDVTVFKVPQYETDNVSGGTTLIIGDDTL